MRKLIPIRNSVICKRINEKTELTNCGILVQKKNVDFYQIIDFSVEDKESFPFTIGDVVMSTSTGDEIEINDNEKIFLFKSEHIMCKVEN